MVPLWFITYKQKRSKGRRCPTALKAVIYWLCSVCLVHFVLLQFYRPRRDFVSQFYVYWPVSFWCLFKENGLHSFYTVWMCIIPVLLCASVKPQCNEIIHIYIKKKRYCTKSLFFSWSEFSSRFFLYSPLYKSLIHVQHWCQSTFNIRNKSLTCIHHSKTYS